MACRNVNLHPNSFGVAGHGVSTRVLQKEGSDGANERFGLWSERHPVCAAAAGGGVGAADDGERDRGGRHLTGNFNVYNLFNGSAIQTENLNDGSLWKQPSLVEDGREVQFSGSLTF